MQRNKLFANGAFSRQSYWNETKQHNKAIQSNTTFKLDAHQAESLTRTVLKVRGSPGPGSSMFQRGSPHWDSPQFAFITQISGGSVSKAKTINKKVILLYLWSKPIYSLNVFIRQVKKIQGLLDKVL